MKISNSVTKIFSFQFAAVSASLKDPSYKQILKSKYIEASTKTKAKLGEDWTGEGSIKCYGQMNILASRPFVDVTGTAECRPRTAPANPQGFIADGSDGSHWVVVDDKGTADCTGAITYTYGDLGLGYCSYNNAKTLAKMPKKVSLNPRTTCGYFTCDGFISLTCDGMLSGCHG